MTFPVCKLPFRIFRLRFCYLLIKKLKAKNHFHEITVASNEEAPSDSFLCAFFLENHFFDRHTFVVLCEILEQI